MNRNWLAGYNFKKVLINTLMGFKMDVPSTWLHPQTMGCPPRIFTIQSAIFFQSIILLSSYIQHIVVEFNTPFYSYIVKKFLKGFEYIEDGESNRVKYMYLRMQSTQLKLRKKKTEFIPSLCSISFAKGQIGWSPNQPLASSSYPDKQSYISCYYPRGC